MRTSRLPRLLATPLLIAARAPPWPRPAPAARAAPRSRLHSPPVALDAPPRAAAASRLGLAPAAAARATLLRAVAGLWVKGSGKVARPAEAFQLPRL